DVAGFESPTTLDVCRYVGGVCPGRVTQSVTQPVIVEAGITTEVRVPFARLGQLRVDTEGYDFSRNDVQPTLFLNGQPANERHFWIPVKSGTYTVGFGDIGDVSAGSRRPCVRQVTV